MDRAGSLDDEKRFLRAWIDDLYLWYREVPEVNPDVFPHAVDYFNVLKTPATTASGKPKDQFHFTIDTSAWLALSQAGIEASYGVTWVVVSNRPPRKIVAAYQQPGSPAAQENIVRGTELVTIDGVDVANGTDVTKLGAGVFPEAPNEQHVLELRDPESMQRRTVTLTSANVESHPVLEVRTLTTAAGPVGYILFNDHIATAEKALIAAIEKLRADRVTDLVLDLRYNGGGYLAIANQLAFMIAGPNRTQGKAFEQLIYNDKYATKNPFDGSPLAPSPFITTTIGLSTTPGQPLPSLDLARVYVLTGSGTCSASESIMNALRGVDVEVVQIGATTCGKPYGFVPRDNCGTTYFAIQFEGVNNKGFGDYADGFVPHGSGGAGLPGCELSDDFTHALGDPEEGRLAAALTYRATGDCPAFDALLAKRPMLEGAVIKSPGLQNRILLPPLAAPRP